MTHGLGFDGSVCVGPKGFTNGSTEEAVSLKDVDDDAGVEGCCNNKLIERPNLVQYEKCFKWMFLKHSY